MEAIILVFAVLVIMFGLASLSFLISAAVIAKDIREITYTPLSENETEYRLRTMLFMYPNAEIHTEKNPISERLQAENPRIRVHQGI